MEARGYEIEDIDIHLIRKFSHKKSIYIFM